MQPDPRFWTGRRVCVTGGTGFLGYHLVRQLLALDAQVRVLALPPRPDHPLLQLSGVELHRGDIGDAITVRAALADCDVILHTAGIVALSGPGLRRMHEVHVGGTQQVLDAAPPQARIVHTSSVVAVGASRTLQPVDEDSPFNLERVRIDYVQAKRAAEQRALAAAQRGQNVVIVNPTYLLGPEDHERSEFGRFCARFWKGQLRLALPGGFNFVDVRDVATGHLLAAERGQAGRRYLLGGEDHTMTDFCRLLAKTAGEGVPRLWPVPGWLLTGAALLAEGVAACRGKKPDPPLQQARLNRWQWFCRSDRARLELGYAPRSLRETLADTYRWHRERWLPRATGSIPPRAA
ncbi:MAG: NAD-dependent epimerase/dehydratase family protein [Planctomycetia bacterium]|nr:NAD-dependent epimerase/dehydratase family protein [Planctomycetia bacterium]